MVHAANPKCCVVLDPLRDGSDGEVERYNVFHASLVVRHNENHGKQHIAGYYKFLIVNVLCKVRHCGEVLP